VDTCGYTVFNSKRNLLCLRIDEKWRIFNSNLNQAISGADFEASYDCVSRMNNIHENKICGKTSNQKFHIIDVSTNSVDPQEFLDRDSCYEALYRGLGI